MYFIMIGMLLVVLPSTSVSIELFLHSHDDQAVLSLVGRWWAFWAVGMRLFITGIRQVIEPQFTAKEIFGSDDPGSLPIVREVGFGNLAFGTLGVLSLFRPDWVAPAAIAGGIYYGLAGAGHIPQKNKNPKEWTAMRSTGFAPNGMKPYISSAALMCFRVAVIRPE
jgi:hypothetical protein